MYKQVTHGVAIGLIPVAAFLLIIGIKALRLDKRSGLAIRSALALNTSLVVLLGRLGCARADYPEVLCYSPAPITDEPVPEAFDKSTGWDDLESTVVELEGKISANDFDYDKYEELSQRVSKALSELAREGLLDNDGAAVIGAYCAERLAWYLHMVGGATCYEPMLAPTGREATLGDEDVSTLRQLLLDLADGEE